MCRMWTRRCGLEGGQSSLVKIGNRIANRLIATADETGHAGRGLSLPTFQEHLTTADGEALPVTDDQLRAPPARVR